SGGAYLRGIAAVFSDLILALSKCIMSGLEMKLVLASDGSRNAMCGEKIVQRIPKLRETDFTLVHVIEQTKASIKEGQGEQQEQLAEQILAGVGERLVGFRYQTEVRHGHSAEELLAVAADPSVGLMVLGAQGLSGLKQFLLGSVSERVARHAPCSTLIARSYGPTDHLRVIVALDDTTNAQTVVDAVASLKLPAGTHLHIVSVMTVVKLFGMEYLEHSSRPWQRARARAEVALEAAATRLRASCPEMEVSTHLREAEDVSDSLVAFARTIEANLVFVGSHGKSALERFVLGSVSEKVLRHAPCSVWVVRPPRKHD
ncbi:MAG: universal stress protein, partial [Nannocystaceae bacterium]